MSKIRNKLPPCNCTRMAKCIRCPCSKIVDGLLVSTCTSKCECGFYCISKQKNQDNQKSNQSVEAVSSMQTEGSKLQIDYQKQLDLIQLQQKHIIDQLQLLQQQSLHQHPAQTSLSHANEVDLYVNKSKINIADLEILIKKNLKEVQLEIWKEFAATTQQNSNLSIYQQLSQAQLDINRPEMPNISFINNNIMIKNSDKSVNQDLEDLEKNLDTMINQSLQSDLTTKATSSLIDEYDQIQSPQSNGLNKIFDNMFDLPSIQSLIKSPFNFNSF